MANKDISPTTIANILVLISTANTWTTAIVKNSKSYKVDVRYSRSLKIIPDPGSASSTLQSWFNGYIKSGSPAAGTATMSSTFTTVQDWNNNFFTVRTELLANVPSSTISALDIWYKKYSDPRVMGGK